MTAYPAHGVRAQRDLVIPLADRTRLSADL